MFWKFILQKSLRRENILFKNVILQKSLRREKIFFKNVFASKQTLAKHVLS